MAMVISHSEVPVTGGGIHLAQCGPGDPGDPGRAAETWGTLLFLHGWPQDWSVWKAMMALAGDEYRCVAIDLPGVGASVLDRPEPGEGRPQESRQGADKFTIAHRVHELVERMGLERVTLVGHDAGGMVAFAYLKQFDDLRSAVIMDTVIPGVPPWEKVMGNPGAWHFRFHRIPGLPETLVHHNRRAYFDYFYGAIAASPDAITAAARSHYADSYADPVALTRGFDLYRTFDTDAADNTATAGTVAGDPIRTPVLYLRGDAEGGEMPEYEEGLRAAGITTLTTEWIEESGHFAPEEAPGAVWMAIRAHLRGLG